jgi:serine/threonine protein kinase
LAPLHEADKVSHYQIIRKLGEGGMGVVYQARDTELERFVALKFLPLHLVRSPETIARFRHEARAISALNHIRIATIYGIEETKDAIFIVLEYLPGGTLRQKLQARKASGGAVSLQECLEWTIEIAEGLAHAHKRGIVHRDIKSSNVLFTEDDQLKIADFGLAKVTVAEPGTSLSETLTQTGLAMGTPYYMSPEQANGLHADQRSDIFSLGVLLFEMVAGELPFRGTQTPVVLHEIVYAPTPSLSQFREGVPAALQSIICKMLEKDPALRYQTADQLLNDLRAVSVGSGSTAPFSLLQTVTLTKLPPARRRRRWTAAAGALAVGLIGVTAVPTVRHRAAVWLYMRCSPTLVAIPTCRRWLTGW